MTGHLDKLCSPAAWLERRLTTSGFRVWRVGGVSRAWRRFDFGGYTLITDPDGYDLPNPRGPFVVWRFSDQDIPIHEPALVSADDELLRLLGTRLTRFDN